MKIIKILNNNIVYARDANGSNFILIQKGIGFNGKVGEFVNHLNIEKIIHIDSKQSGHSISNQLENINPIFFELTSKIIQYAKEKIGNSFNENIYITLADHINFSVERLKKGIKLKNLTKWEIKNFYPIEYDVGHYAVSEINKKLKINLGDDESAFIAMHIVSSREDNNAIDINDTTDVITNSISLIEEYFSKKIDIKAYAFHRFVTHIRFLLNRTVNSCQENIYELADKDFPKMVIDNYHDEYLCSLKIKKIIKEKLNKEINSLEVFYLSIHIHKIRSCF